MSGIATYEERLKANPRWALQEGSMHFEEESGVQKSLRRVAKRLDELGIPYAVAGGMALFFHGYRRFTEDVDILVNRDGLELLHEKLEGLGCLPPFAGSKNLRDTDTGVRIEFLVSGDFPGNGKPKAVAFPDPAGVTEVIDGVKCLRLETLVELKLASGTAAWRLKDLADVQEMIRALNLPLDLAERLNPMVQESYRHLWQQVRSAPAE